MRTLTLGFTGLQGYQLRRCCQDAQHSLWGDGRVCQGEEVGGGWEQVEVQAGQPAGGRRGPQHGVGQHGYHLRQGDGTDCLNVFMIISERNKPV